MSKFREVQKCLSLIEAEVFAAQIALRAVQGKERKVKIKIRELETKGKKVLFSNQMPSNAFKLTSAESLWAQCISKQIAAQRVELSLVLSKKEQCAEKLLKVNSRFEAIKKINENKMKLRRKQQIVTSQKMEIEKLVIHSLTRN